MSGIVKSQEDDKGYEYSIYIFFYLYRYCINRKKPIAQDAWTARLSAATRK